MTGPMELVVIKFPGNQFTGQIIPALRDLIDRGTIRVVDIMFLQKHENGDLTFVELNDLDDALYEEFDQVIDDEQEGLLSPEDVEQLGRLLEPNSSAGLMMFENTWASRLSDAIARSGGQVVLNERIPRQVIEEVEAELQESSRSA